MQDNLDTEAQLPRAVINFTNVGDYDPKSDSLAEQINRLNNLCSAMANTMLTMNQQLAHCQEQIAHLSQATQRDPSQDLARVLKEHDNSDGFRNRVLQLLENLELQKESDSEDLKFKEMVEVISKVKPTLKIVQTQLKNADLRDARIENLYLRSKIPFPFQPFHSLHPPEGEID